ncbi:MAG: hypothetical protein WCF23_02020 [Candidatus Nitrosopolaris sp.]
MDVYTNIKKNANLSLSLHDPPFENIEDAILFLFKITPRAVALYESFTSELRPLVMISAPSPLRFDYADVVHRNLRTMFSNDTDPNDVEI